jgi:hypothetical protein
VVETVNIIALEIICHCTVKPSKLGKRNKYIHSTKKTMQALKKISVELQFKLSLSLSIYIYIYMYSKCISLGL